MSKFVKIMTTVIHDVSKKSFFYDQQEIKVWDLTHDNSAFFV